MPQWNYMEKMDSEGDCDTQCHKCGKNVRTFGTKQVVCYECHEKSHLINELKKVCYSEKCSDECKVEDDCSSEKSSPSFNLSVYDCDDCAANRRIKVENECTSVISSANNPTTSENSEKEKCEEKLLRYSEYLQNKQQQQQQNSKQWNFMEKMDSEGDCDIQCDKCGKNVKTFGTRKVVCYECHEKSHDNMNEVFNLIKELKKLSTCKDGECDWSSNSESCSCSSSFECSDACLDACVSECVNECIKEYTGECVSEPVTEPVCDSTTEDCSTK